MVAAAQYEGGRPTYRLEVGAPGASYALAMAGALGLDAAVAYPTIDFKIRNNFEVPVVLHETVKGGVVRAEILGPQRKRTVSFFRRVDEVTPFEETERETDELPKGKRVVSQRGVPGFKTTVIRIVRDGAYAWRTKIRNQYPPTTQILRVGTGPKDAAGKKVKLDHSLEYRADEYLVLTQGPEIHTPGVTAREPGGGMIEARTPGKYGDSGWQAKLGMPVFEGDGDGEDDGETKRDEGDSATKNAKDPKAGKSAKGSKSVKDAKSEKPKAPARGSKPAKGDKGPGR